jgi:hypothetical protein
MTIAEMVATSDQEELMHVYGAPYIIVAHFGNQGNQPQTFPMMNLDPAIDAARAIHRDGTYYRVRVQSNYDGTVIAEFNRYYVPEPVTGKPVSIVREAIKDNESK